MFEGTSDNSIFQKHTNTQAQAFMFCIFNLQYLSQQTSKEIRVFLSHQKHVKSDAAMHCAWRSFVVLSTTLWW